MALLIANYCKLFHLSPADELGIGSSTRESRIARMNVNIACFSAYTNEMNYQIEEAKHKKETKTQNQVDFLKQLEEDTNILDAKKR